jgi:peptide/nickel transport system substrate-binding protein
VSRYRNPQVDTTIAEMEATTDPAKIKAGSDKLIDVWMTDFPVIALNYAPARLVYRDATTTGWPTDEKPYALDNMLYVITQIRPK